MPVQDRAEWPAQELAAAVGLSAEALRRRIMFWVNQVAACPPPTLLHGNVEDIQGAFPILCCMPASIMASFGPLLH